MLHPAHAKGLIYIYIYIYISAIETYQTTEMHNYLIQNNIRKIIIDDKNKKKKIKITNTKRDNSTLKTVKHAKTLPAMSTIYIRIILPREDPEDDHQSDLVI